MADLTSVYESIRKLQENIGSVFIGKEDVVLTTLVAFFAEGHLLLDDVPGVGKTLLGQALAKSLDASFSRIQFTSDLLPSDVVGGDVYQQSTQAFHFMPGPIFANVILADEVNRTPPRTQSATLEAMSERQVSSGGQTFALPRPFFVVATENPVEFEGTYPLPESQLDRFLIRQSIGYPDRKSELMILDAHGKGSALDSLKPVLTTDAAIEIQEAVLNVRLDPRRRASRRRSSSAPVRALLLLTRARCAPTRSSTTATMSFPTT